MKHYDISQGTDEWFSMRLGIPTASEFGKIITPATQKFSKQSSDYADLKIAEIMTGQSEGIVQPTPYMERGKIMEQEASDSYSFINSVTVNRGGFFTDDTGSFGASPDFLVGEEGTGEIKCLMGKNHVKYLLSKEIPNEFKAQIQGQLYISEREWCDWFIYHPDMASVCIRTYRDEAFILNLSIALVKFRESMSNKIEELQKNGLWKIADNVKQASNQN